MPPGEVRTIGRTIASDVAVGDNFMSGVHFEIENYGDFAEVRDRNSTNKTWVNHVAQVKYRIVPGDVIRAGKTLFSIQWQPVPHFPTPRSSPEDEDIDETFGSDDSGGKDSSSFSPIGSSYAVFEEEVKSKPVIAEAVEVAEVSNFPASSRSCSPFESLDASYLNKLGNQLDPPALIPNTKELSSREFASPFDESSVIISPFVDARSSPVIVPNATTTSSIRMLYSQTSPMETDTWATIQELSKNCDLRVVSHFRKIGQLTPSNLKSLSVFPFIAEAREHLPVIVKASEWIRHQDRQTTNHLTQSDGLVLVVTNGTLAAEARVQELSNCNLTGLPQVMGFLGWCWPSQLQPILEGLSEHGRMNFLGETIDGFLFPSKSNWIACVKSEFAPILSKFGYE